MKKQSRKRAVKVINPMVWIDGHDYGPQNAVEVPAITKQESKMIKVYVITERVQTFSKAEKTSKNRVRLSKLMRASKRGDEAATSKMSSLRRSIRDRAAFLRSMYKD